MSDAVQVALIGLAGIGVTNFFALILAYISLNRKVNGMNQHLQNTVERQHAELRAGDVAQGRQDERNDAKGC